MADAVELRRLFVVRWDDVPGGVVRVGVCKHVVLCPGVVDPFAVLFFYVFSRVEFINVEQKKKNKKNICSPSRERVHRGQLPPLCLVIDATPESLLLLLVRDRKPVFDQQNSGAEEHALEVGRRAEKLVDLFLRRPAHDTLDSGAIVPAPVKDDDLPGGGEVLEVALPVELGFLGLGGLLERDDAQTSLVEWVCDFLDDAALAGSVAPFEDDEHFQALVLDPELPSHELDLELF